MLAKLKNSSKVDNSRLRDTEIKPLIAFKNIVCDRTLRKVVLAISLRIVHQVKPKAKAAHCTLYDREPRPGSHRGITIDGIVKLSEFDQKLGNTRIHNSLIVQHSGYWPELENQPNLT